MSAGGACGTRGRSKYGPSPTIQIRQRDHHVALVPTSLNLFFAILYMYLFFLSTMTMHLIYFCTIFNLKLISQNILDYIYIYI